MSGLERFSVWFETYDVLIGWLALASVLMVLGTLVAIPLLLIALPTDYFLPRKRRQTNPGHPVWRAVLHVAKNLGGVLFVVLGIVMIFTPGQGLLSILAGLILLDIPGKRAMERRVIGWPKVNRAVNRIRAWAGCQPLELDGLDESEEPAPCG